MNAMHLIVFLDKRLAPRVKNVSVDAEPRGIANIIGNKGGIFYYIFLNIIYNIR